VGPCTHVTALSSVTGSGLAAHMDGTVSLRVMFPGRLRVPPGWYVTVGSSWLRHFATSRKDAGSSPDDVLNFLIFLILPAAQGAGIYSARNRNENQKNLSEDKAWPACNADNLNCHL
jgi:hypothetical protein